MRGNQELEVGVDSQPNWEHVESQDVDGLCNLLTESAKLSLKVLDEIHGVTHIRRLRAKQADGVTTALLHLDVSKLNLQKGDYVAIWNDLTDVASVAIKQVGDKDRLDHLALFSKGLSSDELELYFSVKTEVEGKGETIPTHYVIQAAEIIEELYPTMLFVDLEDEKTRLPSKASRELLCVIDEYHFKARTGDEPLILANRISWVKQILANMYLAIWTDSGCTIFTVAEPGIVEEGESYVFEDRSGEEDIDDPGGRYEALN
jgi:hypothetical protein